MIKFINNTFLLVLCMCTSSAASAHLLETDLVVWAYFSVDILSYRMKNVYRKTIMYISTSRIFSRIAHREQNAMTRQVKLAAPNCNIFSLKMAEKELNISYFLPFLLKGLQVKMEFIYSLITSRLKSFLFLGIFRTVKQLSKTFYFEKNSCSSGRFFGNIGKIILA
jgi:hypothetical protein